MILKKSDFCTFVHNVPIQTDGDTYGQLMVEYEVRAYKDVRNLKELNGYLVTCTQRLIVPNHTDYTVKGELDGYYDYPALLKSKISSEDFDPENMRLVDYSPKTLNTAVVSSTNTGQGSQSSQTQQHTTGSSNSQTNSFGGSVSLGFFGEIPTGNSSLDTELTATHTTESSDSLEHSVGSSHQYSSDISMSIKDWGCYVQIDSEKNLFPTWIWGQEYPWNIIQLNACSGLPIYVQRRLFDDKDDIVYPPSELSLLGVDFISKVSWIVYPSNNKQTKLNFRHTIEYYQASHSYDKVSNASITDAKIFNASITDAKIFTTVTKNLNLDLLALEPITSSGSQKNAIIGFISNKFTVLPSAGPFIIKSSSNTLIIEDETDYDKAYPIGSNTPLTVADYGLVVNFANFKNPLMLTVYFKIADVVHEYTLHMKHWITKGQGIKLTLKFNKDEKSEIIKYVTALEAEGGEGNLLSILLRDLSYSSVDYHDYLQVGLNSIEIKIEPVEEQDRENCVYQIRAMSIE